MNKRAFHDGFIRRWMQLEKRADGPLAPGGGLEPEGFPEGSPLGALHGTSAPSQEELRQAMLHNDWVRAQRRWGTEMDPNRDAAPGTRVWGAMSALSKLGPKPVAEGYKLFSLGRKGYDASQKSWQGLNGNDVREENNRLLMRNHRNPGLGNAFDAAAHSLSNSPTIMGSYLGDAAQGLYSAVDRAVGQPSSDPIPGATPRMGVKDYDLLMESQQPPQVSTRGPTPQETENLMQATWPGMGATRYNPRAQEAAVRQGRPSTPVPTAEISATPTPEFQPQKRPGGVISTNK